MEYITTKDASAKWGISTTRITVLASEGRIPGARRLGRSWLIPANATKPEAHKANRARADRNDEDSFLFPVYHLRPDWSCINIEQLSRQQRSLLTAETAVMECRFDDAYPLLEDIIRAPEDIHTEIGALWNAGICCVSTNKPEIFVRIYLRLQTLLSDDIPHRENLILVRESLKTYVSTIHSAAAGYVFDMDLHSQAIPMACLLNGYSSLSRDAMKQDSSDMSSLELILCFLENTGSVLPIVMMHLYILGIYSLRGDAESSEKHARKLLRYVYENRLYFPLISVFRYYASVLTPIMSEYPEDFLNHCRKLTADFDDNYNRFLSGLNIGAALAIFNDEDYPYIYAILMGQSNRTIAGRFGISEQTVKRRISKICGKVGVNTKKELADYLRSYM